MSVETNEGGLDSVSSALRVIVGIHPCVSGLGALRRAVGEARLRHAQLVAVRAWNPPVSTGPAGATWRDEIEAEAARSIEQAFADAMGGVPSDIDVQQQAIQGPAGQVLVWVAERDSDLLVVGTCQRGWPRHIAGSPITRYCIHHAHCPVLVVPPHELGRAGRRNLTRAMRREAERLADSHH
jgi:nucleotide-binding universal stress UspA family protein